LLFLNWHFNFDISEIICYSFSQIHYIYFNYLSLYFKLYGSIVFKVIVLTLNSNKNKSLSIRAWFNMSIHFTKITSSKSLFFVHCLIIEFWIFDKGNKNMSIRFIVGIGGREKISQSLLFVINPLSKEFD